MKARLSLLAMVLGIASFAASADTLYVGDIAKHQITFADAKTFHEVYDFYLDLGDFARGAADVSFAFTETRARDAVNIDFGTNAIKLFDNANNIIWQGTPTSAAGPADALSFDGVRAGTSHFSLTIDGTVVGSGPGTKGSYSFEIVARPVPEPEVYSLAIGGVILVGWAGRRSHARRA